MHRFAVSAFLIFTLVCSATGHAERFHFVAIGDTAYNSNRDYPIYERLIGAINAADPAMAGLFAT